MIVNIELKRYKTNESDYGASIEIYNYDQYYPYHVHLEYIQNKFKGTYYSHDPSHDKIINYLIDNDFVELIVDPIIHNGVVQYKMYKVQLTQSKMLELL